MTSLASEARIWLSNKPLKRLRILVDNMLLNYLLNNVIEL